jgi:hypothetical protein
MRFFSGDPGKKDQMSVCTYYDVPSRELVLDFKSATL